MIGNRKAEGNKPLKIIFDAFYQYSFLCVLLSNFTSQAAKHCLNNTKGIVVDISGTYATSGNGTQVDIT